MHVKVMQWNVWFKEDIIKVVDVLKQHDADIICLQELTKGYVGQSHENTWEFIAHQLQYYFEFQEIPIITEEAQWLQANAIFSKYPLSNKNSKWLHKLSNIEDENDQYRGYLETTVSIKETELTVGTTHLSFKTGMKKDYELERLTEIVKAQQKNYMLTGDMNATPESERIKRIEQYLQHAGPDYHENTWTTKPYNFDGVDMSTLDWRYDYVFCSQDVRVVNAKIVQTDVSDHLPIIVTVEI